MDWENEYNTLVERIANRDAHLIVAMNAATSLLSPDTEQDSRDLVEVVKTLVTTSLDLDKEFDKMEGKYQTWKSSMEMLSEWNEELENENKELKARLE